MTVGEAPTEARRPERVRLILIVVGIAVAIVLGGTALVFDFTGIGHRETAPVTPQPIPTPPRNPQSSCDWDTAHEGVHGTDCRALPVVTAPGELGPAGTGSTVGGTNWEPAFPGSNVWIPEQQISGRLFVERPGSKVPPPDGYVVIGHAPDGSVLYWQQRP